MTEADPLLRKLDSAWRASCKVLFGEDLGTLEQYREWLTELVPAPREEKSRLSGKEVYLSIDDYCSGGQFISLDEIDFDRKFSPLSINEVKDIDSIAEACRERFSYAGNLVLGNSSFVGRGASILDGNYLYDASLVTKGRYMAHTYLSVKSENVFGCFGTGESKYCVKCYETHKDVRCFELWNSQNCSDAYYVFGCEGCQEALFSFNAKGKRHVIGNLELPREKYLGLKAKLIEEMGEELRQKKRLKSLADIMAAAPLPGDGFAKQKKELSGRLPPEGKKDLAPMEEAFSGTTRLLLGRGLEGLDSYSSWLERHTWKDKEALSALSRKGIIVPDYCNFFLIPETRMVRREEWEAVSRGLKLSEEEAGSITLRNAADVLGRVLLVSMGYFIQATNAVDCASAITSTNCYHVNPATASKNCAFTTCARDARSVFGTAFAFDSSFSVNCYYSSHLNRCLEVDNSEHCIDLYFGHNCENVNDSMFCFNVKNLKHAIGNAPMELSKYKEVKSALLGQMLSELEAGKSLKWDIYNVGCPV